MGGSEHISIGTLLDWTYIFHEHVVCMRTMDNRAVDEDPFVDPVHPHPHPRPHLEQRQRPDEDSTLIAGRTASLTLGTDSLIVLGMDNDLGQDFNG